MKGQLKQAGFLLKKIPFSKILVIAQHCWLHPMISQPVQLLAIVTTAAATLKSNHSITPPLQQCQAVITAAAAQLLLHSCHSSQSLSPPTLHQAYLPTDPAAGTIATSTAALGTVATTSISHHDHNFCFHVLLTLSLTSCFTFNLKF